MSTFRKKPVEIDAVEWDGTAEGATPIIDWILGSDGAATFRAKGEDDYDMHSAGLYVHTLEGTMRASAGDWIIRGLQGEFYPCKPDIFEATYETVVPDIVPTGDPVRDRAIERFFTASEHDDVVVLRKLIVDLGTEIDRRVPAGRNKALALTALEDVQMRANRGLFAPEHLR